MLDRRTSLRYPCQLRATIVLAGARRSVTVLDLSLEGALLRPAVTEGRKGLAIGTHCAIRILSADDRELVVVPARITHLANGCIGLSLATAGSSAERMLLQLIEFNLGIGALVRRDARAREHVC